MVPVLLVVIAVMGGGISAATDKNSTREARYIRNEKPHVMLRPTLGGAGPEQMRITRQFGGPPQHPQQHHHPAFPMHLHPGQSGEVIIQRHPQMPGGPPGFVMTGFPPQSGPSPARLYQSPPQSRPQQKLQQSQGRPVQHQQHPPQIKSQPQQQHFTQQQQLYRKPTQPLVQASNKQTIRHIAPQPQFHTTKQTSKPVQSSSKEFRASQPIPPFEKNHHLLASDERYYEHLRPDGAAASTHSKFYAFDNFAGADGSSGENTWQPAIAGPGYPQHTNSAEIQQYQTQERISFYPDAHPDYFQAVAKGKAALVESAGKRKKNAGTRRRVPTTSTSAPPTALAAYQHGRNDDERSAYGQRSPSNVRPIYEYQTDDLARPSKRFDDPDVSDVGDDDRPEGNVFQSVAVSTVLQTTGAGNGDHDARYGYAGDDDDGSPSLFITPAKPDVHDYGWRTSTPQPPPSPQTTTAPAAASTRASVPPSRKRVFRRKFVPPPAADSDTCVGSCLSSIVSRVNDPVCGSDERTYENIGRLRCTKLCGDQHLHVAHFGNCENNNNTLN